MFAKLTIRVTDCLRSPADNRSTNLCLNWPSFFMTRMFPFWPPNVNAKLVSSMLTKTGLLPRGTHAAAQLHQMKKVVTWPIEKDGS